MRIIVSFLLCSFCTFLLLSACREDEEVIVIQPTAPIVEDSILTNINGYVQKGPFINGTTITLAELNENLLASGKNFTTQISDNKGAFNFKGVPLNSAYVQLQANGFYFDEVKGEKSAAQLTLFGLANVRDANSVNVNLLSYLEYNRVIYLMQEKETAFDEAKKQAQREILTVFGIESDSIAYAEQLDIAQDGDDNAKLLAISAILQADNSVAELSELVANIITDLKEDGTLNSQTTKTKLKEQAMSLNLPHIRSNLEKRYEDMGVKAIIPTFEQYIDSDGDGILNKEEDDTPENFTFSLQKDVAIKSKVTSNTIKISGLKEGGTADAVVKNGHIVLNGSILTDSVAQVKNGDELQLQLTSSGNYIDTVQASVAIGTLARNFKAITDDYIPNAFKFTAQKDVAVDSVYTSNTVTVSGVPFSTPMKIEEGMLIKNGKILTTDTTSVKNGDQLAIQLTSSTEFASATSALVDINGVTASFSITTDDYSPDPFSFTPIENAKRLTAYISNTVTISGLPHRTPQGLCSISYDNYWSKKNQEGEPIAIEMKPLQVYINEVPHDANDNLSFVEGDKVYLSVASSQFYFNDPITATLSINGIYAKFKIITENNPWQEKNNYPRVPSDGNDFSTYCFGNGKIYAGGYYMDKSTQSDKHLSLYEYDITTDKWSLLKSPSESIGLGRAFVYNEEIYMISRSDLWRYTIAENKWTKINSAPSRIADVLLINNKAYFLSFDQLWEYDIVNNSWTQKTATPISYTASFVLNGNIYIINDKHEYYNEKEHYILWKYAPQQNLWDQKSDIVVKEAYSRFLVSFTTQNTGYITTSEELLRYNEKEDNWESLDYPSDYYQGVGISSPEKGYLLTGSRLFEFTPPQE